MPVDLREIEATRLKVKDQFRISRCIIGNNDLKAKLRMLNDEADAMHAQSLAIITKAFERLPEEEVLWIRSRLNSELANIIEGYALALAERVGELKSAKSA